jgi:hypothetical protein
MAHQGQFRQSLIIGNFASLQQLGQINCAKVPLAATAQAELIQGSFLGTNHR